MIAIGSAHVFSIFVFTIYVSKFATGVPQIFSDTYEFCEFDFGDKYRTTFPSKPWTVETRDYVLHFSLCKSLQSPCGNRTSSCLIQKRQNKIIDFGSEFRIVESGDYALETVNGARCPSSDRNYTLTVTLECSETIRPKPRLIDNGDECGFEVSMMKPDCRPRCTELVHGAYFLDIRNFAKDIEVHSDARKFVFTLCGSTRKCGSRDVSSCEVSNGTYIPLAKRETQSLNYDISKNELTARGRFKEGRVIRQFQVLIKCNWQTELARPTYRKVPEQGKYYKFELESSYGCVKLPQDCFVTSIDNVNYNLSNIYKPGGWQVAGVPQGKIMLNICGPLKQPRNACSEQQSQVCHVQQNKYTNRGSILTRLAVDDDVVKASLSSGSICTENSTLSYSTEIEFKCSRNEKGPVFKEFNGCVTLVTWDTPHACPVDYYRSSNCYMNDRFGNRNLQKLASTTDKNYKLSPDTELVYNLCEPIHAACNSYNNVSFCLKKQRNDVVIGWDTKELISDNGLLRMELAGSVCSNRRSYSKVTVNFVCNYEEPSPPPRINIIEDGCKFNVTVFTIWACLSENTFPDCVSSEENVSYDISPLSYRDRNYVIADGNVDLILNVCGPIVNGPDVLCKKHSMLCLRNKTEVDVSRRFTSLGVVSTPKVENNSLIIESKMGTYCQGYGYYRTIIYFECSQRKFQPVILAKEPCTYKLLWKTPEACPIKSNCKINSTSQTTFDLTHLEEKNLQVNVDNGKHKYSFDLCTDIYQFSIDDGTSGRRPLRRELYFEDNRPYLLLDMNKTCDNNSNVNKVLFEFECSRGADEHFKEKSFENCVLNMTVHTQIVCPLSNDSRYYSIDKPSLESAGSPNQTVAFPSSIRHQKTNKCVIISRNTGYELKMNKIQFNSKVYHDERNYSIDFGDDGADCLLCQNGVPVLPKHACPGVFFNDTNEVVRLLFLTEFSCASNDFFQFEILMKCDPSKTDDKVVENEKCKLIMEYSDPEICLLFGQKPPTRGASGGIIAAVVIAVIIIISGVVGGFCYYKRRYGRFPYLSIYPKNAVPIYCRDSTE